MQNIEKVYREKYKDFPLENIIIFRSGPMRSQYIEGTDFADNARALFEYMLENNYNKKYELVWLVKEPSDFDEYRKYKNVSFLSFDWEDSGTEEQQAEYYRCLCLAKYIFMTDTYGFALNSRKDQIRIQLWHGCGFKTRMNFGRCEDKYDYTTVISDTYAGIHEQIYGLRKDQVVVTGYAKHDWLFKPYEQGLDKVLECKKCKKYIFWMPTLRTAEDVLSSLNEYIKNPLTGLPVVQDESQMKELDISLKSYNIMLIIKLHPFQKRDSVIDFKGENIKIIDNRELHKKDLVINRLLASADALVSDYSSTAIDFLNTDKPMAFTLDDEEEYKNSRGFVFDNIREWLPGKEIFDFEDFCSFISDINMGNDSEKQKRKQISTKLLKYKDSGNCKRILEKFNI